MDLGSLLMRILADPTSKEYLAASLACALVVNFILGNVRGLITVQWQLRRWSGQLASQYLSPEMKTILQLVYASVVSTVGAAVVMKYLGGSSGVLSLLSSVVAPAVLTALAAAAGMYSAKVWHEDLDLLIAIYNAIFNRPPVVSAAKVAAPKT